MQRQPPTSPAWRCVRWRFLRLDQEPLSLELRRPRLEGQDVDMP